ncbi:hypothetical protein Tco_0988432 [Tanacetum coccineum]|uniref:Uncharacterized protein n=1 Tax=Tanacetum coccineum TaxID=301880 RepID=A0ABQ5ERD6_9ASTR
MLLKRISELEQHMADLIQDNLALEERLDKHRTWLYNLENLNIPYKVSQAVDEIMLEDNSYKAHDVHNDLHEALQKSLELDYLNQHLADQEEARKMKRKRHESPRTPPGSPPSQPPPLPPLVGTSGAPGTSGASRSSQMPLPPPPPSAGTSGSAQQQGDDLMHDDSIPDEQVHLSNDEDSGNNHLPKENVRTDWWKPLPEEERPATPPHRTILGFFPSILMYVFNFSSRMEEGVFIDAHQIWVGLDESVGDKSESIVKRPLPLGGLSSIQGSSPTLSISLIDGAVILTLVLNYSARSNVDWMIHDSLVCRIKKSEQTAYSLIVSTNQSIIKIRSGLDFFSLVTSCLLHDDWQDVFIVFFAEVLDVYSGCVIRRSLFVCSFRDSGHDGGCISHCAHSDESSS